MFSMTIQQKMLCVLFIIAAYVVYVQVYRVEPFDTLENKVLDTQTMSNPVSNPMSKPVSNPMSNPMSKPLPKPVSKPVSKPVTNSGTPMFVPIKQQFEDVSGKIEGEPIRSAFTENYGQQRQRTYQMDTARNLKRFIRP